MGTINYRDPSLLANIITNGTMSVSDKEQLNIINTDIQSIKIALDGYGTGTAGEATLIDGYAQITLAEGIPLDAIIMFSRKTAIGTIGDLSLASQNINEFTLVSSSSLDQSIISWSINRVVTGSLVIGNTTGTAADGGLFQAEIDRSIMTDQEIKNVLDGYVPMAWFVANCAETDWYLDAVFGDDNNLGTYPELPIRTVEELSRRLAVFVPISHSVIIHILAGNYGLLALRAALKGVASRILVIGTTEILATTTLTSVATYSHSTATMTTLSSNDITNWTPYIYKRLKRISDGSVCWISKVNPESLGDGYIATTVPITADGDSVTWVVGDVIVVENLLTNLESIDVSLAGESFTTSSTGVLRYESLAITHSYSIEAMSDNAVIWGCFLSGTHDSVVRSGIASPIALACQVDPHKQLNSDLNLRLGKCLIRTSGNNLYIYNGYLSNCIAINITIYIGGSMQPISIIDLQSFDRPGGVILQLLNGANISLSGGFSGKNVYGIIRMPFNSMVQWYEPIASPGSFVMNVQYNAEGIRIQRFDGTMIGALDCLGTAENVWRKCHNYQDGAESGIATIGADGYVVNLDSPIDWDLQRLVLTLCDPTGTPGVLYAPRSERVSFSYVSDTFSSFKVHGTEGDVFEWQVLPYNKGICFRRG